WAHPREGGEGFRGGHLSFYRRTPAQAGKGIKKEPTDLVGAHPRAGGEGSTADLAPLLGRLTPAQAGKGVPQRWLSASRRAHPRAGGEGMCEVIPRSAQWGAPPRRRGGDFATSGDAVVNPDPGTTLHGRTRAGGRRSRIAHLDLAAVVADDPLAGLERNISIEGAKGRG